LKELAGWIAAGKKKRIEEKVCEAAEAKGAEEVEVASQLG
jgi:hypothetical protein